MKYIDQVYILFIFPLWLMGQGNTHLIALDGSHWEFQPGQVTFSTHNETASMELLRDQPPVVLKDVVFQDGTIEFDVELTRGRFVGIQFRRASPEEYEWFYLRTSAAGDSTDKSAIQYAPIIKGITLWDMLNHYQGPANFTAEGWNHVKLVISGRQMRVYINETQKPTLVVPELLGNTSSGSIAFDGNAKFANVVVKHDQVEGLQKQAGFDPTQNDPHYLRKWLVSPAVSFPLGKDIEKMDIPTDTMNWSEIHAERLGLINLTRKYGGDKNNNRSNRKLVWLKTTITSKKAQTVAMDLGFSDEVGIVLNDQLIYKMKNYYNESSMKEPSGRCSLENSSIDLELQQGKNELLLGVGNFFFGWGIVARLNSIEGIVLNP